eukprot:jgi/Botrbrau1/21621/Bobra.43_1s0024.1
MVQSRTTVLSPQTTTTSTKQNLMLKTCSISISENDHFVVMASIPSTTQGHGAGHSAIQSPTQNLVKELVFGVLQLEPELLDLRMGLLKLGRQGGIKCLQRFNAREQFFTLQQQGCHLSTVLL